MCSSCDRSSSGGAIATLPAARLTQPPSSCCVRQQDSSKQQRLGSDICQCVCILTSLATLCSPHPTDPLSRSGNEFCERLAYYGLATNLVTYLTHIMGVDAAAAAVQVGEGARQAKGGPQLTPSPTAAVTQPQ